MRKNLEVEKRAKVDKSKLESIKRHLSLKGKTIKEFERFSIVYLVNQDFTPDTESPIDVRIRVTNGKGQLCLKYGDWRKASRSEYEVHFDVDELEDLLHMLKVMGYQWGVVTHILRKEFKLNDLTVTLDEYLSHEVSLVEIERMCTESEVVEAEAQIDMLMKSWGIEPLGEKKMLEFVAYLNSRMKWRFDFTHDSIEEKVESWKNMFNAKLS